MRTYLRIIAYGRPYYRLGVLALITLLIYTIFNAATVLALIPFLEILFNQDEIIPKPEEAINWLNADSIKAHGRYQLDQAIEYFGPGQMLWYFCGFMLILVIIKNISRYSTSYLMSPLEQGIIQQIRNKLFSHLSTLGLDFYTSRKKGDIVSTVLSDVQLVQDSVIKTVLRLLKEPLTMLTTLILLFFLSPELTLFTLIVLPVSGLFINYIRKSLKRKARKGQEVLAELVGMLDEFTSGIRIVKSFQKEEYEQMRYQDRNQRYTNLQVSIRRRSELASPVTEIISFVVILCIIAYGGSLILSDQSSLAPGDFLTFIVLFTQFIEPIKVFSNIISKIQKGIAAFERIENLLNTKAGIEDKPDALDFKEFREGIRFDNVYFKYAEEDVLKDINFEIKRGQTVALVGPSGSGKSTIADLIPRFYDPYKGSVRLDGKDIKDLKISELRSHIGIVAQEGVLFHDTVLKNIAYGMGTPNREEVIEASKIANAHEFIMQLPEQYDTMIGERGTRLSGGQRQRIAIARAVLRNPAILILDEATSNLDTESERLVQDALDQLMESRTSLVIAHRLSTILSADQIIVLEKGKILERGSFEELLEQNGLFKKLYSLQFEGESSTDMLPSAS